MKNSEGQDSGLVGVKVLDAPSAPEGPLKATEVTADTISLSWKPPKDVGGEPVNNYILEKKPKGSDAWQKVSNFINSTNATVRNLEQGTEYEFRVMAENQYGVSEPLETQEAIKAKPPYDPPGACNKPEVEDVTADSVTLSWNPPKNNGGAPIQGYIVEKRAKGDRNWTKDTLKPVFGTEYTAKNLPEGKEFEFRVTPVNKAGPGEASEPTDLVKVQAPTVAPKIRGGLPKEVVVANDEEFKVRIPYVGSPEPEIELTKDGKPVDANRYNVST